MASKIALVAGGHGKYRAPFKDPAWECWGVNTTWYHFPGAERQFTRWFELHRKSFLDWEHQDNADNHHYLWMRGLKTLPLYVQRVSDWPDFPTATAFPYERLETLIPTYADYHACSLDWMLALAILEAPTEIKFFGVEQWHSGEPVSSRACLEFWAGVAEGRGIHVTSECGSTFKLAKLVYTKTPYAEDPAWLPWGDDADAFSELSLSTSRLRAKVIEADLLALKRNGD